MAAVALTNGNGHANPPSETLYCSNLDDKLQKDDLKRALYMLMVTYGPVLDIVALKTRKMRGQAHVLFRDKDASTQALRALQNYNFFGKPMKLSYAKSKSDTLAKLDGTYKQPQPGAQQTTATTAQQLAFGGAAGLPSSNGAKLPPPPGLKPPVPATEDTPSPAESRGAKRPREESEDEEDDGDQPMDMDDAPMDESDDD